MHRWHVSVRGVVWSILSVAVPAMLACNGGSRGWVARQQLQEHARLMLIKEATSPSSLTPTIPADLGVELLRFFDTKYGRYAAEILARSPDASTVTLPGVLLRFRESMSRRFSKDDRTEPGESPPLQYLRDSCLVYFQRLGPKAGAAAPDLLELLRRRESDGEFVGSDTGRFFRLVLESVLAERPDLVVEAARSPVAGVRSEACAIMGDLREPKGIFGPVLVERIDDDEDLVAHAALQAMLDLRWASAGAVERVRARISRLKAGWMRAAFEAAVIALEKMPQTK